MASAPIKPHEEARLNTVARLDLTSTVAVEGYDSVARLIQLATQAPICLFSVVDKDRQYFKSCRGLNVRETPREYAFCGWAIAQDDLDQVFCVEDAEQDERFCDNPLVLGAPYIRFYAGIPVLAPNGLPVGTLCVIDTKPRPLTPELIDMLNHGRRLLEESLQLYSEAVRDPLTGLYNRRFLAEAMDREWRRAYRQLLPLSILVADIDHFKIYNDTYGHQQGDQVIKAVAKVMQSACARPGDLVTRYGGEEFLIVLPETNAEGAKVIADRLVKAVADLAIPHGKSAHQRITISAGVSVIEQRVNLDLGHNVSILIADQALYRAKANGRNGYDIAPVAEAIPDAVPVH